MIDNTTRGAIIRSLADHLTDTFDYDLQDKAFEALLEAGVATDDDETIDEVEDLALSLKIEALDHFLADLGWQLAPRTEPSNP